MVSSGMVMIIVSSLRWYGMSYSLLDSGMCNCSLIVNSDMSSVILMILCSRCLLCLRLRCSRLVLVGLSVMLSIR